MKTNIELKDFLNIKFLSDIKAKEDGTYAYIKHDCNADEQIYEHNLYVNGKPYTNRGKASLYLLEEDSILYVDASAAEAKRKETETFTSFYRMPINGGAPIKAFEIPYAVSSIECFDENVYVLVCNCHKEDFDGDVKEKRLARKQLKEDVEVLEEIPFYFNGAGFVDGKRSVLFLYNEKQNELKRISNINEIVESFCLDQAHRQIYYASTTIDVKQSFTSNLCQYDVDADKMTLLNNELSIHGVYKTTAGLIVAGSRCEHYGINENAQFFVYQDGNIEVLADYDLGVGSSVGSDCRLGGSVFVKEQDDILYFVATQNEHASIFAMQANGDLNCIYDTKGSVDGFAVAGKNLYFIMMEANGLQEVYCMDLDCKETKKLTSYNDTYLATKTVVPVESCDFENDGIWFQGWVLKPTDFDPNKKYPAVFEIHGGPKTVFGSVYHHEMQVLANQGYFVFYTNPRGSDGRGNEFADIRGKYGTIDYDDLMKFTDTVLAKYPQIDEKRVGVCGGSYGGFMTNWMIGHTNRFSAAVTQRSIANWISFYNTSDIGEIFGEDQCGGNPWDNYEKLWNHSPLKYVRNAKTPTLVIHADEDYRCPLSEGLQMYSALAMRKVDTKMVIFKHENHDLSRSGAIPRRIKRLEELTGWMNKYLKGED